MGTSKMKKRHTGLVILVMLEIAALVLIVILGVMKMLHPDKDTRQIHTTEAATTLPEQTATPEDAQADTTETEAATTEAEAVEPVLAENITNRLAKMTLEEKISLLFVVSPEKLTGEDKVTIAGDVTRSHLEQYHIGGLCYSHINYVDETQIKDLLTNTQTMATDTMGYTPVLFARDNRSTDMLYATRSNVGGLCSALAAENGVKNAQNGTLAQKLVCYPAENAVPEDAGIVMFEAALDDAGTLACMSAEAVQEFRSAQNYTGILMTGRLDTAVVTGQYTAGEAAIAAVQAGMDMLYEPENFEEAYEALVQAVKDKDIEETVIDQAAGRILTYMDSIGYLGEEPAEEAEE